MKIKTHSLRLVNLCSVGIPVNSQQSIMQICECGLHIQSVYTAHAFRVGVSCVLHTTFFTIKLIKSVIAIC